VSQGGYIKLWRKSLDSAVWADPNLWRLWTLCLMLASHKEHWVKIDGLSKPIKIGPGQFISGRNAMHRIYYQKKRRGDASPLTLWRWLGTLQTLGNLNIETNTRFSLITIVNWADYQGSDKKNEQANEHPVNKQRTSGEHKQEGKECKEEKNTTPPTPPRNGKTTAPDIFPVTDQMRVYAMGKGLPSTFDLDDLTEAFLIHHRSRGSKFANWYAAWQKWLRNEIKFRTQRGDDPRQVKSSQETRTNTPEDFELSCPNTRT